MTKNTRLAVALLGSIAVFGMSAPAFAQSGEVNIYSYREQSLLQPLLDNQALGDAVVAGADAGDHHARSGRTRARSIPG